MHPCPKGNPGRNPKENSVRFPNNSRLRYLSVFKVVIFAGASGSGNVRGDAAAKSGAV
jgi:hypothetical protein